MIVSAVDSLALLRYSGGVVKWTKLELMNLDRNTRKLLSMNDALHPRANVSRVYLSRKEGGRGLVSVEDCVRLEELSLDRYLSQSEEKLLKLYGRGKTKAKWNNRLSIREESKRKE